MKTDQVIGTWTTQSNGHANAAYFIVHPRIENPTGAASRWGGLPRTFFRNDNVTLAAGEAREWDEYWIPFARTGGLNAATPRAVLGLTINSGYRATVGVAVTQANTRGTLVLLRDGSEIKRWTLALDPSNSFREQLDVPSGGQYKLRLIGEDGAVLAETR